MTLTKNLTWDYSGGDAARKEVIAFGAGEDVLLSFTPGATTTGSNKDLTGRTLQLVIADTQEGAPLVSLVSEIEIVSLVDGTFRARLGTTQTLTLPTDVYVGELRSIEAGNNTVLRRINMNITANPLASGELPSPTATVAWAQIVGTPTTLAGYGITDALGGGPHKESHETGGSDEISIEGLLGTPAVFSTLGSAAFSDSGDFDGAGAAAAAQAASQPLDAQLTALAGLSYASNSLKVIRVNAGETGFELAPVAGGTPTDITVTNEATDATCFFGFFTAATGDLGPKTNAGATFNALTGVVTFAGAVLGPTDFTGSDVTNMSSLGGASDGFQIRTHTNVAAGLSIAAYDTNDAVYRQFFYCEAGTVPFATLSNTTVADPTLSGTVAGTPTWASTQSLDTTGNAGTATIADESTDATCFPVFVTTATGAQALKTNATNLKFDASTGKLYAIGGFSTLASGFSLNDYSRSAITIFALAQADATLQTVTIPSGNGTLAYLSNTLDQFGAAAGDINLNSHGIIVNEGGSDLTTLRINPAITADAPWKILYHSSENAAGGAGTYNHACFLGHNTDRALLGGGSPTANRSALIMGFESDYYDTTDSTHGTEWYIEYFSPNGTSVQLLRPFEARIRSDSNSSSACLINMNIGSDGNGRLLVETVVGGTVLFILNAAACNVYVPLNVTGNTVVTGSVGINVSPSDNLHINASGGAVIRLADATASTGGDVRISQVGQVFSVNTYSNGHVFTGTPLSINGATQKTTITGTLVTSSTIELGNANDTTLARVSAGVVSIEGVNIVTASSTETQTNKTLTSPTINSPSISAPTITSLITCSIGASTVDTENIRFNRTSDGNRYNSIYSLSTTGGAASISFKVHDGVSSTSQITALTMLGTGRVGIGASAPAAPGAQLEIDAGTSSTVGLLIKAAISRSVAITKHQTSAGASLGNVSGGCLSDRIADVATTHTDGTFDTLETVTFPANALIVAGDKIYFDMTFSVVGHGANTCEFKVAFAGVNIFDSAALTFASGTFTVNISGYITMKTSTTCRSTVKYLIGGDLPGVVYKSDSTLTGLTLTGTNNLTMTAATASTGAASGDVTLVHGEYGIRGFGS